MALTFSFLLKNRPKLDLMPFFFCAADTESRTLPLCTCSILIEPNVLTWRKDSWLPCLELIGDGAKFELPTLFNWNANSLILIPRECYLDSVATYKWRKSGTELKNISRRPQRHTYKVNKGRTDSMPLLYEMKQNLANQMHFLSRFSFCLCFLCLCVYLSMRVAFNKIS